VAEAGSRPQDPEDAWCGARHRRVDQIKIDLSTLVTDFSVMPRFAGCLPMKVWVNTGLRFLHLDAWRHLS
jgi:hypothetical protein